MNTFICNSTEHEWCDSTCPHSKPHLNGSECGKTPCETTVICNKIERAVYCKPIQEETDAKKEESI